MSTRVSFSNQLHCTGNSYWRVTFVQFYHFSVHTKHLILKCVKYLWTGKKRTEYNSLSLEDRGRIQCIPIQQKNLNLYRKTYWKRKIFHALIAKRNWVWIIWNHSWERTSNSSAFSPVHIIFIWTWLFEINAKTRFFHAEISGIL